MSNGARQGRNANCVGPDCTPEGVAARCAQIAGLRDSLNGGIFSVSDRGRTVTYRSAGDMLAALRRLENEALYCDGARGNSIGGLRMRYHPQSKNL